MSSLHLLGSSVAAYPCTWTAAVHQTDSGASPFVSRPARGASRSALVVGVAGEAELGEHEVGEAERHDAVDLRQPVEAVGPLEEVFGAMPHPLVPAAGLLLQVAEVHGFDEDPGGFLDAAGRALPQVERHGEVDGDVVAVLRFVHQRVDRSGLVLEELQVAAVEEGSADQHHGVSAGRGSRQEKLEAAVAVHASRRRHVFPWDEPDNLVGKLLRDQRRQLMSVRSCLEQNLTGRLLPNVVPDDDDLVKMRHCLVVVQELEQNVCAVERLNDDGEPLLLLLLLLLFLCAAPCRTLLSGRCPAQRSLALAAPLGLRRGQQSRQGGADQQQQQDGPKQSRLAGPLNLPRRLLLSIRSGILKPLMAASSGYYWHNLSIM
ncbi:hypothetical protein EYF80_049489 [Liparis tanakae]|uniref:Uncharacterized protein n=1 Tax=Liparis tanakae TaxID=230148 RepID=A0A4Z2FJA1_9TELE|nr:hypothetical protein EYF80_049489 [Liparis tanakae]